MGRTTFEPALGTDRWPWPDLDVFVLASERPPDSPKFVVTDSDPTRLLGRLQNSNRGGNVYLVGGPRTIETYRALGALDKLGLILLPLLIGGGMRLTPSRSIDTALTFESEHALPGGALEVVYAVGSRGGRLGRLRARCRVGRSQSRLPPSPASRAHVRRRATLVRARPLWRQSRNYGQIPCPPTPSTSVRTWQPRVRQSAPG